MRDYFLQKLTSDKLNKLQMEIFIDSRIFEWKSKRGKEIQEKDWDVSFTYVLETFRMRRSRVKFSEKNQYQYIFTVTGGLVC